MKKIMLLLACLVLFPLNAFALLPFATDDTGTMGQGKFQLEVAGEFGWNNADGVRSSGQLLESTVTAGLLETVDLVIDVPVVWSQKQSKPGVSGMTDLALSLKWRFLELGPFSLAVSPGITLPAGDRDKELGTGRVGAGATLVSTFEVKPVAIHANVGYTRLNLTADDRISLREDLLNLSLAGIVSVTDKLQLGAELFASRNSDAASRLWPVSMAAGLSYALSDSLSLALGARWGLTKAADDVALLTGVTVSLP